MPRSLDFHPGASLEAEEAIAWYRQASEDAGSRLESELDRIWEAIVEQPGRFARHRYSTRRAMVLGFPYWVVFRERGELIQVVAVAHHSRKPNYWRKKLKV